MVQEATSLKLIGAFNFPYDPGAVQRPTPVGLIVISLDWPLQLATSYI